MAIWIMIMATITILILKRRAPAQTLSIFSTLGAEQPDDLAGEQAGGRSNIDDERIFVWPGLLERVDLTLQQARVYEVPMATAETFCDEGAAAPQIDQPNLSPITGDDLAVAALQGGAGDD